jgi:hypothetical protein
MGADLAEDRHRVPPVSGLVPGVLVQAVIANTILTGLPVRGAGLLPGGAAISAPLLLVSDRLDRTLVRLCGACVLDAALVANHDRFDRTGIYLRARRGGRLGAEIPLDSYPVQRIGG